MNLKKLCEKHSFTIKGGYHPRKIGNIHQHLQEVQRGVGVKRPKKGKGSYTRKHKHRNRRGW